MQVLTPKGGASEPGPAGPPGPEGPPGAPGTGVDILGSLDDPADLPGHGNPGDAYLINGDLWVWTGDDWDNVGSIQGPAGLAAGFGTPTASATGLAAGANPTAGVVATGTDIAKVFAFTFGIPAGPAGSPGTNGAPGAAGAAAGFGTPTASGLAAGAAPTVAASGPDTAKIFAFGLPAGATGAAGATGPAGLNWRGTWAPSVSYAVNDAVQWQGSSYRAIASSFSVAGSTPDLYPSLWAVLAAQGAAGAAGPPGADSTVPGPTGPPGDTGPAGPGVPTGGSVNQILTKNSTTNFDTIWRNGALPAGGASGQVLAKTMANDFVVGWIDRAAPWAAGFYPAGAMVNYNNDLWIAISGNSQEPSITGTTSWRRVHVYAAASASVGQVLTKTGTGVNDFGWQTPAAPSPALTPANTLQWATAPNAVSILPIGTGVNILETPTLPPGVYAVASYFEMANAAWAPAMWVALFTNQGQYAIFEGAPWVDGAYDNTRQIVPMSIAILTSNTTIQMEVTQRAVSPSFDLWDWSPNIYMSYMKVG